MFFRIASLVLGTGVLASAGSANAAVLEETVEGWRLQNYLAGDVRVYFTSASGCTLGKLNFPSNATDEDKDRFWSLVLTAKATGKKVGIFYSGSGETCAISSFYLAENG